MDLQENTDLPLSSTEDEELRFEQGILSNARTFSSVFERLFEKVSNCTDHHIQLNCIRTDHCIYCVLCSV